MHTTLRRRISFFAAATLLFVAPLLAQQPKFEHASLSTHNSSDLSQEIAAAEKSHSLTWLAWPITVRHTIHNSSTTTYLEGERSNTYSNDKDQNTTGAAIVLLRIADNAPSKLRLEASDHTIDAGDTSVVFLPNITAEASIRALSGIANAQDTKLTDSAIFIISQHNTPLAISTLADFTNTKYPAKVREKAAFWLATQGEHEGFLALQRMAHTEPDASVRKQVAFDFNISKDPAATDELIRMAHEDSAPEVRKQAQFWMAHKGGEKVAAALRNSVENDPEANIRKQAVFALTQLPREQSTTELIRVADTSHDLAVRKQAIFWLGESHDPRALEYLTKLIQK